MTPTEANGTAAWRLSNIEKRLDKIEDLEPAVLVERVDSLSRDVQSLKRAFYTFAFSVVGAAVVFAFSVFSLLGPH